MLAYSNNCTHLASEFTISVPLLASASASAWGTWHTQGLVHTNCGPQLCSPPPPLDVVGLNPPDNTQVYITPNEHNQCVFVRYYTMRRRVLMFPKIIKAAAGPHNFDSGNNCDETFPELTAKFGSDPDPGLDTGRDPSSSDAGDDPELELCHNAPSVCWFWPPLSVLTSLFRRRKTLLISSQNMSSK